MIMVFQKTFLNFNFREYIGIKSVGEIINQFLKAS